MFGHLALAVGLCCVTLAAADIYSCGGYVRSSVPIDFAKIQVKLFSPEGHLKQEEEVNAQTGYYMMPVYNKGQYSLRVSAPTGWYFEPASVEIKIDGNSDACSKNEDINFKLVAFDIEGAIESSSGTGPAGLKLNLLSSGNQIATTVTSEGGRYSFKAPPGKYEVSAGADGFACISVSKSSVVVKDQPVRVEPSLKISGYHVDVAVTNNGAPIEGVSLNLYSSSKLDLASCKAVSSPPKQVPGAKFVCELPKTNAKGQSSLQCVPPGAHSIVPSFNKEGIEFQFTPDVIPVKVSGEKAQVSAKVSGFSTRGRVELKGKGVSGVAVYKNGDQVATTSSDGYYTLSGLKEGKIELTAKAENTKFSIVHASLKLPKPEIPAITVTGFELCGSVERSPDGSGYASLRIAKKGDANGESVIPDANGNFCRMLAPADYVISPSSLPSSLTPRQLDVDLNKGSRSDVRFTHFKTDVEVRVDCIGACEPLQMQLSLADGIVQTVQGTDAFVFKDIAPGKYTVRVIDNGHRCWASSSLSVEVERSRPEAVHFEQTGFQTHIKLSHPAHVKWSNVDRKDLHGELSANAGRNDFCVPVQGKYSLTILSCRTFDRPTLDVQVPSESINEANALDALLKGTVIVKEKTDIKILVVTSAGERTINVDDGAFSFREPLASSGEIRLVPQSATHLFEPASATFRFAGECIDKAASFQAHKGIFVDGEIKPAVEGVRIVAQHTGDVNVKFETKTDKLGKYRVGPVKRAEDLKITASMEGYAFSDVAGKHGQMTSVRLSKLTVAVVEQGGEGGRLEGVLLSVVGGREYRSNNMLDASGEMNFVGLAPGDYFLRPILQEFKFEPSQTTVTVKEGEHQHVELKGRRVAWSAFGRVREMSGAAVSGAIVEALAPECDQHQSEGTTDKDGSFRIRALKPGCAYKVSIKSGPDGTTPPHCFPSQFTIKMTAEHVKDLEMVVAPSDEGFELLVAVDTKTIATQPQSIRVSVYKGEEVVHTHTLVHPVHIFALSNLTRDGAEYSVRVEPERPPQLFVAKEVTFVADRPVRALTISLAESKKHHEVEISFTSLLSLPFFGLLALAVFNQQKTTEFVGALMRRAGRSESPSQRSKKRN